MGFCLAFITDRASLFFQSECRVAIPIHCLKVSQINLYFSSFADTSNPFVEMHSDIPKIINMAVGREMIIPCRVTAPDIAVTLKKVPLSKHALKVLLWMMFLFVCLQLL